MNGFFYCVDCSESDAYANIQDLEAHISAEHLNIFPFECEKCKFAKFPTEYALINHYGATHGLTDFIIKYRYTSELASKRKELTSKLRECLSLGQSNNDVGVIDVTSTEPPVLKPNLPTVLATATILPTYCPSELYLDASSFAPYQSFLDETLQIHEEETAPVLQKVPVAPDQIPTPPAKVRNTIACSLCKDVISKQRSSMVYHANTRHGKLNLYECGYCQRRWQTVAKSDVLKHIKTHHKADNEEIDMSMVIDYRKTLTSKLKTITDQCFPERKRKRTGYTDVGDR